MKIAIYLSGQPRYLHEDWIWNSITNLFNEHEVDFYFHFWESEEYTNEYILDRIKPKNYKFESQVNFTSQAQYIMGRPAPRKLPQQAYFNMLSFYYSFAQARTIVPTEEYDFILKTRTDVFFTSPLNHYVSESEDRLLIDPIWKKPATRHGDICFFGNPEMFSNVLDIAEMATSPEQYFDDFNHKLNGNKLTSHRYLAYMFKRFNINFAAVPMEFLFMRPFVKGTTFETVALDHIRDHQEVHTQLLLLNFPNKRDWISNEINQCGKHLKDKALLTKP